MFLSYLVLAVLNAVLSRVLLLKGHSVAVVAAPASSSSSVINIDANSVETFISNYDYLVLLFFDGSSASDTMRRDWDEIAKIVRGKDASIELGAIDCGIKANAEAISADFGLTEFPAVLLFRNGAMSAYRGPMRTREVADFIMLDHNPPFEFVDSPNKLKSMIMAKNRDRPLVIGFFDAEALQKAAEGSAPNSGTESAVNAFETAFHQMSTMADFVIVTSEEVMSKYKVKASSLPVIALVDPSSSSRDLIKFREKLTPSDLVRWILPYSRPEMQELRLQSRGGKESYAAQFLSSAKTKFILFLPMCKIYDTANTRTTVHFPLLNEWKEINRRYKDDAVFTFTSEAGSEIGRHFDVEDVEYESDVLSFRVFGNKEFPAVVGALEGRGGRKYKSPEVMVSCPSEPTGESLALRSDAVRILDKFVADVIAGTAIPLVKSEKVVGGYMGKAIDAVRDIEARFNGVKKPVSFVKKALGVNVEALVADPSKDIVLGILNSDRTDCAECLELEVNLDLLSRAVDSESRLGVVKIDLALNDLPAHWNIKSVPAVLFFSSKSKTKSLKDSKGSGKKELIKATKLLDTTLKEPGYSMFSLENIYINLLDKCSFDVASLAIASDEQIGMLLSERETVVDFYRARFERAAMNSGRAKWANPLADMLMGEVVYSGRRWHIVLLVVVLLFGYSVGSVAHAPRPEGISVEDAEASVKKNI